MDVPTRCPIKLEFLLRVVRGCLKLTGCVFGLAEQDRRVMKSRTSQPVTRFAMDTLEVGQKLKGTVKRVLDFGAFVDVGEGLGHLLL